MTPHPRWSCLRLRARRRALLLLSVALVCLSFVTGCAYGGHLDRGDEYFAQRRYELALHEYQAALKLKPDSDEALARVERAKRSLLEVLAQDAQRRLTEGDYPAAIELAAQSFAQAPRAQSTTRLIAKVVQDTLAHSERLRAQEDFAQGLALIEVLYERLPSTRDALELTLSDAHQAWAQGLARRAQAAERAGHLGDALLLYAKAAQLVMTPQAVAKRDELRARLLDTHVYTASLSPSSGSPMAQEVLARLRVWTWAQNIRFVSDKDKPMASLELGLGQPSFSRQVSTSSRTARYKSGTRQVPNPAYKNRQDDILREQRDQERYQQDVLRLERDVSRYQEQVAREGPSPNVSTGAEQNLSRAQSELSRARDNLSRQLQRVLRAQEEAARTPQLIEEDVYSDLTYPVNTHSVRGELSLHARVAHADARPALATQQILSTSASDTEHAAYAVANISLDPLSLPSQDELTERLKAQAAASAADALLGSLTSHRQALLAQAQASQAEGERVHRLVVYILLDPTRVEPQVERELEQRRGVPASVKLLGQPD